MTKIVKSSEFKSQCLALIDEVAATGNAVLITKDGEPLAELVPHRAKNRRSPFGIWQDTKVTGDIIAPVDAEWDAMK